MKKESVKDENIVKICRSKHFDHVRFYPFFSRLTINGHLLNGMN